MGFYDLSKDERQKLVKENDEDILQDICQFEEESKVTPENIHNYASDNDTYIRKNAYMAIGRIYFTENELKDKILRLLDLMLDDPNEKVRQTSIYALGEIGNKNSSGIIKIFERGLKDDHHTVRNAVIGALKRMGQKNPKPTFEFVRKHLHDSDPKIRREMVHGIELRGRTHPEDVLPILKELQDEKVSEVQDMIVHVIGQISYKSGCLEKVIEALNGWEKRKLIIKVVKEILNVHKRYNFAVKTPDEAEEYIKINLIDC